MNINLQYDASALAAPQSFRDGMQTAANILNATFTNAITINIAVSYGVDPNGAQLTNGSLGGASGATISYSNLRNYLSSVATTAAAKEAVSFLPNATSIGGQSSFFVANAEEKAFGVIPANNAAVDGHVWMGTGFTGNLLVSGALHELTHAMGRLPGALDLFRFNEDHTGAHVFGNVTPAPPAYFSIDGGATDLADFGINSDPSDFLNPPLSNLTPNDAFNEFVGNSTSTSLSSVDITLMNAIGFSSANVLVSIESAGATTLMTDGMFYYVRDSNGNGPSLKLNGADVLAAQIGSWTPIGAEKTASGYEVAWKVSGADQYTIWNTDNNGAYTTSAIGVVPGSNTQLQSAESLFQQDLNGDGHIGQALTLVEALGQTTLATDGSHFFLRDSSGNGPSLKYNGGDVLAAQIGSWTPIGAEKTASGYEVAWKVAGADQYTIWNTDYNGAYTTSAIGVVPGSNVQLQSAESVFQQDLNRDGFLGIPH